MATLDEAYGLTTEDVLDGFFLHVVRRWMTPIQNRVQESAYEAGKNLESKADDIAGQMTDFLAHEANKSDATTVIMADKHAKSDLNKLEKRLESSQGQLEDYYSSPEVP